MSVAALLTWLVAAVLGFVMLSTWVARGGVRAATSGGAVTTRLVPGLIFGHFLLAVSGLVVWIIYLITDTEVLTWVAFALLIVVAGLGDLMFLRWYRGRGTDTVESRFPIAVVYTHGVFAVATIILVLLVALGVGGS